MEIDKIFDSNSIDSVADNVFGAVNNSVSEAREMQRKKVAENVQLIVQALKKIEQDIVEKYDDIGSQLEKRITSIKDGKDGINGKDGRDGKDGKPGKDGKAGKDGKDGRPGLDGVDGQDGVSVVDAHIDFDGSLIIHLSTGKEINVGEVVAPDIAEKIKVITNGGGTSQEVIDTLASLQSQIDSLIPSQTGNAGKFLTTNGTSLSWGLAVGGLSYQGTWNASTNTPSLASGTGTNGYYYIVSVAGTTNLDGVSDWQVGDWLLFNGTVWQKLDQTNLVTSVNSYTGAVNLTASDVGAATSAQGALANSALQNVVEDTSPQLGGILDANGYSFSGPLNGTVGATTPASGAFTTLAASGAVTLSGGTANGVLYLNGSKVATSGSDFVFDGTNVGIGTSSPGAKLDVSGAVRANVASYNQFIATRSSQSWVMGIDASNNWVVRDETGGDTKMYLSTSGNLGLGVTPSAWLTAYGAKAIQLGASAAFVGLDVGASDRRTYVTNNMYIDSGGAERYINTDVESKYVQAAGEHRFNTAPSGTAGNAITFTQAMTLDASGNLGIGTSSPDSILTFAGNITSKGSDAYGIGTNGGNNHFNVFATGGSGAVRFFTGGSSATSTGGGGTERARIDSSGNLLVGTTSGSRKFNVETTENTGSEIAYFSHNAATTANQYGVVFRLVGDPNGTGNSFLNCLGNVTQRAAIRSNGGIANYQANDVNLSDRSEKTNFAPAEDYLSKICAIPVQTFNYADQNLEEDPGLTLGVVAQDVQAVAPELVMESNWGTEEEPKMRLSIYQTDLQYALMKCIQELSAKNDELTARIAALESK